MTSMIVCEYLPSYLFLREFTMSHIEGGYMASISDYIGHNDNNDFDIDKHDIIDFVYQVPYKQNHDFIHRVRVPKNTVICPPTKFVLPVIMKYKKLCAYDEYIASVKTDFYKCREIMVNEAYNKFVMKTIKKTIHLHSPLYNIVEKYL